MQTTSTKVKNYSILLLVSESSVTFCRIFPTTDIPNTKTYKYWSTYVSQAGNKKIHTH